MFFSPKDGRDPNESEDTSFQQALYVIEMAEEPTIGGKGRYRKFCKFCKFFKGGSLVNSVNCVNSAS